MDIVACRFLPGFAIRSEGTPNLKEEGVTPLKKLILDGFALYTEDFAGIKTLVCVAVDEAQAQWLAGSLSTFHKVEVEEVPYGSLHEHKSKELEA